MDFLEIRQGIFINLAHVTKIIVPNVGIYEIRFEMGCGKDGNHVKEKIDFKTEEERQDFIEKRLKSNMNII